MARTIHWPTAALPAPEAPEPLPPTLLESLDSASLSAALGPELTRLFATRISAKPITTPPPLQQQPGKPPVKMLAVGRVRLSTADGPTPFDIAIEGGTAAILVERLFGSRPAQAGSATAERLTSLPPGSGSWISLCRFLATAITKALAAVGQAAAGAPLLPPRAAHPATPHGATFLAIDLDVDGAHGTLTLIDPATPPPLPAAEPPPPPDAQLWRRRTHARALQLELPVALRLADARLLLSDIAALRPGDVVPLARPRALGILVGGHRLADIPAHRLLPADPEEPNA